MAGDFLEMITEILLSERLGEELEKNTQYKAAIAKEEALYESLSSCLSEEQQAILKNYFDAANATSYLVESIIYRLGMRDLLSLLRSLSQCEEEMLKITPDQCSDLYAKLSEIYKK